MGGGLWGRSNREELSSLWDVWIHILGIWVECACWEAGGPSVPPLRRRRGKSGRRAESSRPTEWSAGNGRVRTPTPTGIVGEKRRAHNVRPYKRERGKLPPHPSGLRPATFPPGGRLRKNKKGQVLDLSLKTQRRNAVSQKVLLPTFLSRKVGGRNFSQKLPCFSPLLSNLIRKCKFSFRRLDTAPLGEYHRNDTNLRQNTGRRGGGRLGPGEVCHAAKIFRRGPSRFL